MNGEPWVIPGHIEAEYYDYGGLGVRQRCTGRGGGVLVYFTAVHNARYTLLFQRTPEGE